YVFRIAITNARIVNMDDGHVTFRYKDRATKQWRHCRLDDFAFLDRFLQHVYPRKSPSTLGSQDLRRLAFRRRPWYLGSMRTIRTVLSNVCGGIGCLRELLGYGLKFLLAMCQPQAVLAARLLAVESQLGVYTRRLQQKQEPRPRFTAAFRFLWVVLSKLWGAWEEGAHLMQPATVKKWHEAGFRLFWRWKSRRRGGRPPVGKQMRDPIRKLSRENALWGAERIRETLVLLGYDPPCEDTV
ncbi:unnamed protein product, partial [marine sediment metagenome]